MAAADHKHTARVLLHEARARRGTPFAHVLLRWAGNARRRAATATQATQPSSKPGSAARAQMELFA